MDKEKAGFGKRRDFDRRRLKDQMNLFEHGKIPPQALDIEEALLGILMSYYDETAVSEVARGLRPEIFYKESHQVIAEAIVKAYKEGIFVDMISVTEILRTMGSLDVAGGSYYLMTLCSKAVGSYNVGWNHAILFQKFMQREIIRISQEVIKDAYEDTLDVFQLIDEYIGELENTLPRKTNEGATNSKDIASELENSMFTENVNDFLFGSRATRWKRFNEVVTISRDKLILIAGGAKHAKTKMVSKMMFDLCEDYKDIAIFWCTFEDSKYDILRSYIATKVIYKPKAIKLKKFPLTIGTEIRRWLQKFKTFDITFRDQPLKSRDVVNQFRKFCDQRPDKFCVLLFDNVMAAADREDFPKDLNAMYDGLMANMSNARQWTKQLVIVLHHYNDAQQDADGLLKAYRPRLKDIKGTEAFRRVPTQVLMINFFKKYKDLIADYTGDMAELINYMYVIDAGANREDDDADDVALIHFFINADYTLLEEIKYPEVVKKPKSNAGDTPAVMNAI